MANFQGGQTVLLRSGRHGKITRMILNSEVATLARYQIALDRLQGQAFRMA